MHRENLRTSLVVAATVLVVAGWSVGLVLAGAPSPVERPAIQPDESPGEAWNGTFGDSGDDKFKAAVPADDGGFLVVGQTGTAEDGADGWLVSVDDAGEREFDATFGGPGEDRFSDVVKTDEGYLLAGWRTTDESTQGWLLQVDEEGTEQWSVTLGGPGWDGFWKLAEGPDGDFLAVGRSQSAAWAVKVDPDGEVAWNRTYAGDDGPATFGGVAPTDDGFLLAGWAGANEDATGMAVRVDGAGDEQWSRSYDEDDGVRIWAAQPTDDGFLLAGEAAPDDESARAWARIVDEDGEVESSWTDDSAGSRFIDAVAVDDGLLLFGGAEGSETGFDAMAMQFDEDLEPRWTATAGGPWWDLAFSGMATDDGYLLVGATTSAGAGGQDGWLVKLKPADEG